MWSIMPKEGAKISHGSYLSTSISSILIYSLLIPLLLADLWFSVYQTLYFSFYEIPKVPRRDYLVFDRGRLQKLTWMQRLNCFYCDYANGITAWFQALVHQTEIYSCAIKHRPPVAPLKHQEGYYDYERFV